MRTVYREWFRDRETFADRLYIGERLFAVADGMGIGKGAVVAAEKAIEILKGEPPPETGDRMRELFLKVNREVMSATAMLGDRHVSGTTLSVLSLVGDDFIIGHVGDSRIYLIREGKAVQLTKDQVNYQNGKKQVNVLGIDWNPEVCINQGECKKEDLFLLISDGFAERLSCDLLEELFSPEPETFANKLYQRFLEEERKEDLSFVIISVL
jgi:protein phosphatase